MECEGLIDKAALYELLNPPDAQDEFTDWMRREGMFRGAKRLPDGTYAGLFPLMFSTAICIGVTPDSSYRRRYCFNNGPEVFAEYQALTGFDSEPRGWIATRPFREPPDWSKLDQEGQHDETTQP